MSNFNSIFNVVCSRRSCREFEDKGVEREKIGKILEAARWAPSPGNMQSWEFIVVQDPKLKEKVSGVAKNFPPIKKAPMNIVVLSNLKRLQSKYKENAERYALQETAACIQNMLLVSCEEGLGSCWTGEFQENKLKKILKIPEHVLPVGIVCIGYPKEGFREKEPFKYKITEVTFWNEYGKRIDPFYDKFEWKGLKNYAQNIKKRFFRI